jgi:hypothetical protein
MKRWSWCLATTLVGCVVAQPWPDYPSFPREKPADTAACRMEVRKLECSAGEFDFAQQRRCREFFVAQYRDCMISKGYGPRPRHEQAMSTRALPRGFYCASEICARQRTSCEQYRVAAGDQTTCRLSESAFCFMASDGASCTASLESCQRQFGMSGEEARRECLEEH